MSPPTIHEWNTCPGNAIMRVVNEKQEEEIKEIKLTLKELVAELKKSNESSRAETFKAISGLQRDVSQAKSDTRDALSRVHTRMNKLYWALGAMVIVSIIANPKVAELLLEVIKILSKI